MDWQQHITTHPDILYGKPVIKGTRVPVDLILEKLSLGETIGDLLEAYPHISREDVFACLAYATALLRADETIYLAA